MKNSRINLTRNLIQTSFALLLVYIGVQFFRFVQFSQGLSSTPVSKPGSVEGFLPLSALLGLKNFIMSGEFDPIHPAGLAILLIILAVSLLFKKGFCGWLCPIGTLSEAVGRLGKRIFGKNLVLPKWLDWPLMTLKYLVLGFFIKTIFFDMSLASVQSFIVSPYNLIADVKMLDFFTNFGGVRAIIILVLVLLSFMVRNFWCRYLCPYGALTGLLSWLSPFKVRREPDQCISCGACTKACPNSIDVAQELVISSVECSGCLSCVAACPKEEALGVRVLRKAGAWWVLPLGLVITWVVLVEVAKLTGHWDSLITAQDYTKLLRVK